MKNCVEGKAGTVPEGGVWGGSVGLLILVEEDLVALHHHAHAVPGPATQQPLYTPQISTSFSGRIRIPSDPQFFAISGSASGFLYQDPKYS